MSTKEDTIELVKCLLCEDTGLIKHPDFDWYDPCPNCFQGDTFGELRGEI